MAGIPKVKITFDADFDDLKKGVKGAQGEVEGFADKVSDFGKKAAVAFAAAAAAAGAYAIKLAVDGVKAALEDEQAQVKLANALTAATGATDKQIDATEKMILQMSLATGVADDKLRPAFQRIAISTGDLTKAQDLLALSLDVATATGKPLETVANAISKAYDGNTAALGKLGIGISATELKTLDFTQVQQKLTDLFGGAAAANADTYAGKIAVLKVGFDEAKETLGMALLPEVGKFVDFLNKEALPSLELIIAGFTGEQGFTNALGGSETSAFALGEQIKELTSSVGQFFAVFSNNEGTLDGFLTVVRGLITALTLVLLPFRIALDAIIRSINELIQLLNRIPGVNIATTLNPIITLPGDPFKSKVFTGNPNLKKSSGVFAASGAVATATGGGVSGGATGGAGTGSVPSLTGSRGGFAGNIGEEMFRIRQMQSGFTMPTVQSPGGGFTDSQNAARLAAATPQVNVTVNGAIDPESTARQILNLVNDSFFRGTGGAGALQGI